MEAADKITNANLLGVWSGHDEVVITGIGNCLDRVMEAAVLQAVSRISKWPYLVPRGSFRFVPKKYRVSGILAEVRFYCRTSGWRYPYSTVGLIFCWTLVTC